MPIEFIKEYPYEKLRTFPARNSVQATQEIEDEHLSSNDRPDEVALKLLHENPQSTINLVSSFRDVVPDILIIK